MFLLSEIMDVYDQLQDNDNTETERISTTILPPDAVPKAPVMKKKIVTRKISMENISMHVLYNMIRSNDIYKVETAQLYILAVLDLKFVVDHMKNNTINSIKMTEVLDICHNFAIGRKYEEMLRVIGYQRYSAAYIMQKYRLFQITEAKKIYGTINEECMFFTNPHVLKRLVKDFIHSV